MVTIERITQAEGKRERARLERELGKRYGTVDRRDLRDLSLSGHLSDEQIAPIERLQALDFLIKR